MAVTFETTANVFSIFIFLSAISFFYFSYQEVKSIEEINNCYYSLDIAYECIELAYSEGSCKTLLSSTIKSKENYLLCKDNSAFIKSNYNINDFAITSKEISCIKEEKEITCEAI